MRVKKVETCSFQMICDVQIAQGLLIDRINCYYFIVIYIFNLRALKRITGGH